MMKHMFIRNAVIGGLLGILSLVTVGLGGVMAAAEEPTPPPVPTVPTPPPVPEVPDIPPIPPIPDIPPIPEIPPIPGS